jgi:hypothetical protein
MSENNNHRRGDQRHEKYYLEMFRCAIVQHDQRARQCLQDRFGATVQSWLNHHPRRAEASRLDSEGNYVAEAFKRLWQENVHDQKLDFPILDAALTYLRACLNSVVLDKLRAYSRPKDTETGTSNPEEQPIADQMQSRELWETMQAMLSTAREQRLAYLLFHCGLKPSEIMYLSSKEFSDIQEIYQLRYSIFEELQESVFQIR